MRKDHVCGFRTLRRQISSSVVFPPLKQLFVHVLGLREFKSGSWRIGGILQPLLTGCYWTRTGGGVDLHHYYWGISSNGSRLTPPPRGHPPLIRCDRGCCTLGSWSVSNHVFISARTTQVFLEGRDGRGKGFVKPWRHEDASLSKWWFAPQVMMCDGEEEKYDVVVRIFLPMILSLILYFPCVFGYSRYFSFLDAPIKSSWIF